MAPFLGMVPKLSMALGANLMPLLCLLPLEHQGDVVDVVQRRGGAAELAERDHDGIA